MPSSGCWWICWRSLMVCASAACTESSIQSAKLNWLQKRRERQRDICLYIFILRENLKNLKWLKWFFRMAYWSKFDQNSLSIFWYFKGILGVNICSQRALFVLLHCKNMYLNWFFIFIRYENYKNFRLKRDKNDYIYINNLNEVKIF